MRTLILLLVGLSSFNLSAQHWAPDNAKWHYKIQTTGFCTVCTITYLSVEVTGDTLINGQQCKVLSKNYPGCIDNWPKSYTYEDSGRVYWYNHAIDDFTILYDFNATVNDSWEIMVDTCSLIITVDSVGVEFINGDTLKKMFISDSLGPISGNYSGFFTGLIIETIGNPWYMFPTSLDDFCHGSVCDGDFLFGLNCYEDSILGFYETGLSNSCDTTYSFLTISTEDISTKESISIIPNPFANSLQIEIKQPIKFPYLITVYSMTGQQVFEGKLHNRKSLIDLEELSSGSYLISLSDNDQVTITKQLMIKTTEH